MHFLNLIIHIVENTHGSTSQSCMWWIATSTLAMKASTSSIFHAMKASASSQVWLFIILIMPMVPLANAVCDGSTPALSPWRHPLVKIDHLVPSFSLLWYIRLKPSLTYAVQLPWPPFFLYKAALSPHLQLSLKSPLIKIFSHSLFSVHNGSI